MMRFSVRAPLLCTAALLGGCAVGLPPDPVASDRRAYADGASTVLPSRSALQGVPHYGAPYPYSGGNAVAPVGLLPRAVAQEQPGLASGVDAPPIVASGSSMAGPAFGDIAGAGPAIDVRERRYANGATQDVVYRAPATASGENRLTVSVMETSYKGGSGEPLKLSGPSLADIESEIRTAFPVGSMTITDDVTENASGVFGYAHGRVAGEMCLYAWQFIAPTVRRNLIDDLAGLEGYDVSVRLRFCGRRSVSDLVALMKGMRLHLDRLGGQQGLFAAAPTLTPAVLLAPGPVVVAPFGAASPALPATGTSGIGAQPAGTVRDPDPSGMVAPVYVPPGNYVPVLLPGQSTPVLMLRPPLAAAGFGRPASTGVPRTRIPVRHARPAARPRGPRDSGADARPLAAPAPFYRGLQVRTVRPAGSRSVERRTSAAEKPLIPLPGGVEQEPRAAVPAAAPAISPPNPPASASIAGLPMPR